MPHKFKQLFSFVYIQCCSHAKLRQKRIGDVPAFLHSQNSAKCIFFNIAQCLNHNIVTIELLMKQIEAPDAEAEEIAVPAEIVYRSSAKPFRKVHKAKK